MLILNTYGKVLHEIYAGDVRAICSGKFIGNSDDQIWLCTYWGNYGIRRLYNFDGKEILFYEPNNEPSQPIKLGRINGKDFVIHSNAIYEVCDNFANHMGDFLINSLCIVAQASSLDFLSSLKGWATTNAQQ